MSLNDFLNLCDQLRTVPELVRYLDERKTLPDDLRLVVGAEDVLFGYYLLNAGSFADLRSLEEAKHHIVSRREEFGSLISARADRQIHARRLEHIADQLSERHREYRHGLSQAVLARYDSTSDRRMYLEMQELIAGMMLAERAELGRVFAGTVEKRFEQGGVGFTFMAALVPSHPRVVFLFGSFAETASFSRDTLLRSFHTLTQRAMAHYRRTSCLIVVDRNGESYEVGLAEQEGLASAEAIEAGRRMFGSLRTSEVELRL